jgi:hypothetical protein
MPCSNYCSSGWNNEAAKGSTCVKAVNTTTEALAGCGTIIPSGGLTCYCKNPAPSIDLNPDYDTKTSQNDGSSTCNHYCHSGWNNEADKGSTCVQAVNTTTGALADCGTTSSGGLTCYCKNPAAAAVLVRDDDPLPLVDMGGDASCSPNCDACVGDCDRDGDCAEYLRCFQRESSTSQVPGCSIGGAGDVNNYDYCYDPYVEFGSDYDTKTRYNDGTTHCNSYCSSGVGNEAVVGSTCTKAVNTTTGTHIGCDMISSGGLTCYCKNPTALEFENKVHSYFTDTTVGQEEHGNIEDWDVTNVVNMSKAFMGIKLTTPVNLSKWDVSNVVSMSYMFKDCNLVLTGLGSWNTQNVKNMAGMFAYTENFNNDISSWSVRNVINMNDMFRGSTSFNRKLQRWIINPGDDFSNYDMFLGSGGRHAVDHDDPCKSASALSECVEGKCKGYNYGISYTCNPGSRNAPLRRQRGQKNNPSPSTWGSPQERGFRELYKPMSESYNYR